MGDSSYIIFVFSVLAVFAPAALAPPSVDVVDVAEQKSPKARITRASTTPVTRLRSHYGRSQSWHSGEQFERPGNMGVEMVNNPSSGGGGAESKNMRVLHKQLLGRSRLGQHLHGDQRQQLQDSTSAAHLLQEVERNDLQASSFARNLIRQRSFQQAAPLATEPLSHTQRLVEDVVIPISEQTTTVSNTRVEDAKAEEIKAHLKFSYFATSFAGAGIIGIYTVLGNKIDGIDWHIKICSIFATSAFISGASIILLSFPYFEQKVPLKIFKVLKYTTLSYLFFAVFFLCISLMKASVALSIFLAYLPILFRTVI